MAIDNNESYYNNLLLENLDNSIPVVRTTETPICPIPEKNILVDSVSRKESGNITTDIHYNAKNNENKITK